MTISKVINNELKNAFQEGIITPNKKGELLPEMLFPFTPNDILGIHTYFSSVGDGVFFLLKDGRYFNSSGEELKEAKPQDFDAVAN